VGKALSGLVGASQLAPLQVRHVVICLEIPEKSQFIDLIRHGGGEVIIAPALAHIDELVATADIVQLEWWNHPATIQYLCGLAPQPIRLLVWCHVSGLYNPIIPPKLLEAAHRFVFTSPCSFEAAEVAGVAERLGNRLSVVSSGGGFNGLPDPTIADIAPISVGYLGSLNFAKLHPAYVDFLAAVNLPNFKVRLIGDLLNREILEKQSYAADRAGMLDFRGFTTDVGAELSSINVLAYLLNPRHYGTAENALLEAMAMGIVPIVLDNPAERNIVEHQRTGLIVRTPGEFANAIEWLAHNPEDHCRIGMHAATSVRERFSPERMGKSFSAHYEELMIAQKRVAPFREVFGATPDEWFLSCQSEPQMFLDDSRTSVPPGRFSSFILMEKTKGSVFHFLKRFPDEARLQVWAKKVESMQ
jgi:glycosyltransferase involved in cell wall biosynthesis